MAKQVCDLRPGSMSRGQSQEHLRNYKNVDPERKKYGWYDPTRMHLNFEIGKGGVITPVNQGYDLDKRFQDICKARGIQIPEPINMKDEKKIVYRRDIANIILGGSTDRMRELAFGNQTIDFRKENDVDNSHIVRHKEIEEWALDQYRFICNRYGEENIVGFVCHLDEKNPHIHCTLIPEVNGKISYNKIFGGPKPEARQKYKDLHDAIAEVNKKWGLERGTPISETGARHRTSEEYWQELKYKCNELEKNKGDLESEVAGLRDSLKLIEGEIKKNETKVKGLTTMVNNKMSLISSLEKESESLENKVLTGEYNLQQIENDKKKLDSLIQSNQETLARRRREIEETEKLLELLKKQHAEKLQQVKEISDKLADINQEFEEKNNMKIDGLKLDLLSSIGNYLMGIFKDFHWENMLELRTKLPLEDRPLFDKFFDKTFIPELAENGDEIIKDAMSFFLGKEGEIVQMGGGGGGGHGLPWKKRDDEDDDHYMLRCIGMACQIVRSRKRQVKR